VPSYRLLLGAPGASSAGAVAARMGMPTSVLERADALLRREDRQLDRVLSELAASRASLESEHEQASRLRAESEATRNEYREKLMRLQERRDALFADMQRDLDNAFKEAHAEVAGVIRELQRGGSAQQAARARSRLQELEREADDVREAAGVPTTPESSEALHPVDWPTAAPGLAVQVRGGGRGSLLSLPDRKGRVRVRVGTAKLVLDRERVGRARATGEPEGKTRRRNPVRIDRADAASDALTTSATHAASREPLPGGTVRCDLRGERVAEALDRLSETLDRALADARDGLLVIHGHGTGALRQAVRQHLAESPHTTNIRSGQKDEGGEGATLCDFR